MRTRVKLLGTGTLADPYRIPLPAASLVTVDYATGLAVVDVPDTDVPQAVADAKLPSVQPAAGQAPPSGIPARVLQAWSDFLDVRYTERKGSYKPQLD